MSNYLLSLDLSTSATGYAVFDIDTKQLTALGVVKGSTKGMSKLKYPEKQLRKMMNMADEVINLISNFSPFVIVIEEITGSKNRLTQKTLDGMHYILVYYLKDIFPFERVFYYDVSGLSGWRTHLRLNLDDADKLANKEARKLNEDLPTKHQLPIIGKKHLACRHANFEYGLDLNYDLRVTDGDIGDAVSIGNAFLKFRCTELQNEDIIQVWMIDINTKLQL